MHIYVQIIATRRQQNQKMIELRFLVGRENNGTSLRSGAQSKQAEFEVSKTQQNLKVAMAQLAKALGKNELSEVSIKGEFQFHKAENTKFALLMILVRRKCFIFTTFVRRGQSIGRYIKHDLAGMKRIVTRWS